MCQIWKKSKHKKVALKLFTKKKKKRKKEKNKRQRKSGAHILWTTNLISKFVCKVMYIKYVNQPSIRDTRGFMVPVNKLHTCCVSWPLTYNRVSWHTYVRIHIHIHTIHTYIHAYMHTCIHAYMHTYIHAYMHTYIHTYIHTYRYILIQVALHKVSNYRKTQLTKSTFQWNSWK